MTDIECLVTDCPATFTTKQGVKSHFVFTVEPPHPLSRLPDMTQKIDEQTGAGGASDDRYPPNWDAIRQRVLARDEYQCQRSNCDARGGPCGSAKLHVHHIIPVSEGGSHDRENLVTLCRDCHSDTHGRPVGRENGQKHWAQQSGDDLIVRCGRCDHPALLQRNPNSNRIICGNCGEYAITGSQ